MNRFLHTNMKHLYRCLIALASIMFLPIMARGQMVEINTGVNQIQVNLLDRGYEPGNITHLKVSGIIDVRDLCYIRDYISNLEELDLSGITKIEDYQGRYTPPGLTGGVGSDRDGDHYYPANELPPQAFSKWVNGRVTGWNNPLPKLKKVILPSCIISIGEYAFYVNKGIENILIGEDNLYFKTIDGVLYDKEGKTLLQYPLGRKGDFTLPASVTKIESMGMNDASFTNLTLQTANPPELTSSPFKATTVWIPKGSLAAYRAHGYWRNYTLREIGGVDPALTVTKFISGQLKYKVTGDNTVSVLGPDVAEGSGQQGNDNDSWTVTDCVIPATVSYNGKDYAVKAIEDEAFSGALNMKSISLPEGLVKIGYEAFYRCYGLQSLHIPASVVSIDTEDSEAFFSKLDVETITVANGNPKFTAENNILYNKAKTQVLWSAYLPSDKEMILPETVTDIRAYAFAYQDHLTSMTCPAGIKIIGSNAFADCESLTTLRFRGEIPPSLGDEAFSGVEASGLTVYVPKGSKPLYEKWNIFSDIVEEGGNEEPIGGGFTIGQLKYTVIGKDEVAISGVTDKTPTYYDIKQTVTYESVVYKVTTVGKEAFKGCTNLVRFNPESIRMVIDSVGEKAFDGCSRLSNLIFSEGLKTIGDYAFNGCASLGTIDIPASVTYIGEGVFDDCSKLSLIRVKTANKRYSSGNGVLYNRDMTTLLVYPNMRGKTYTVPQGVTRIERFAFYNCTNLESVTLPDGLVSIGDGAFDGCTGLEKLTLPASLKSIGMGIVDHCEKTLKELHSKMVQPLSLGEYPEYAFFYYSKQSDICTLYVPKGSKDNYSKAAGWKNFKRIVEEGESMNPEVPERTDSTLTVVWEPVAEATDYILKIYRDAAKTELIATYTFDANGKLKSIGFSYQLKGLEAGSTYYIETTAVKQANGETVILAQSTTVAETTGSSVDNEEVSVNKPQIRIGNGQIWIQSPLETEVRIYNLSGYCVCAKRISGTSSIRLSSGMYIVLIGEERYKIVVR